MTLKEHLLVILSEECAEVQKDISKALRFGLQEIRKEQPLTNAERIMDELADIAVVVKLCQGYGFLPKSITSKKIIKEKMDRKMKYIKYSDECGTISDQL